MIYDQLIIGCGVAGLVELKRALEEKKSVCVVAKNFGATQFLNGELGFSGAKEFCEFYGVPAICGNSVCVVGADGQARQVRQSGGVFKTQGLTFTEKENIKKAAFVAIPALTNFPAALVEGNLKKTFPEVSRLIWSEIELNQTSPHAHLLQLFDSDECVAAFEKFLKKNKGDAELIICPPILGIKKFVAIHGRLEKNLGVRIVEQLSTTPPVAGLRFTEAIKKFFVENEINVVWGRVNGFEVEGDVVRSVKVDCHAPQNGARNDRMIFAKEFTLATGKFVGGGIIFKDGVKEVIFNLPCVSSEGPVSDKTPITNLITRNPKQDQALWGIGVLVDKQNRVIDPVSKKPIYENLRAVGHVCVKGMSK